jgi:hypothetical protein
VQEQTSYLQAVSILVVQLVSEGLLFGADRNITTQLTKRDGSTEIIVSAQSQRPKVLKWPNRDVIVGYVGEGIVEGHPTDDWLYAFIGRNLDSPDLETVAQKLNAELDALYQARDFAGPMLLHLGGFEDVAGIWTPRVFFIRNTTALNEDGTYEVGPRFECSEELGQPHYYGGKTGDEIRQLLRETTFSFRQGYDLGSFGVFAEAFHEAVRAIILTHPGQPHPIPTTLDEWRKHVALAIHGYGAYFAAFYPPFEQYVGGGADVVSVAWPPPRTEEVRVADSPQPPV